MAGAVAFHSADEREGERDEGEGECEEERVCGEAEWDGAEGNEGGCALGYRRRRERLSTELPARMGKDFGFSGIDERSQGEHGPAGGAAFPD